MGGTLPWARGVGRPTLGWGEGAFLGFPCRTSFSLRCVPPLAPGVRVVRPTLAFPPLLPARAPPSWHVRLQEIAKPWLWRPELGPLPSQPLSPPRSGAGFWGAGPAGFLSGPGRRGGRGGRSPRGTGRTTQQGALGTAARGRGAERAGRLPGGGPGRAERGADGTTGAGWGGNGTGATMER